MEKLQMSIRNYNRCKDEAENWARLLPQLRENADRTTLLHGVVGQRLLEKMREPTAGFSDDELCVHLMEISCLMKQEQRVREDLEGILAAQESTLARMDEAMARGMACLPGWLSVPMKVIAWLATRPIAISGWCSRSYQWLSFFFSRVRARIGGGK